MTLNTLLTLTLTHILFSAERETAGAGTGVDKVEEGNTDHQPGLSLGDGPAVPLRKTLLSSEVVPTPDQSKGLSRPSKTPFTIVSSTDIDITSLPTLYLSYSMSKVKTHTRIDR